MWEPNNFTTVYIKLFDKHKLIIFFFFNLLIADVTGNRTSNYMGNWKHHQPAGGK